MTDQVEVQEDVTQEEDQAFEAAFAEVRGEEPPTEPEPAAEEPKAEEPEEEPKQEFVTEQPPEHDPVSELRNEIEGLKKALHDNTQKIHGKMGEAFRTLQTLQQQKQSAGVELTMDDLDEELREQFPEMAALQLKSLQKALGKALGGVKPADSQPAQPAFDPSVIDHRINQVASEVETRVTRNYEEKMLEMRHPDFRDVIQSDQFHKWTQMQPAAVQDQILNSVDSSFASRALDAFKQWRTSGEKRSQQKTNRLEAAVVPKGVSPQPAIQDEDTAFAQEYMRRRARVLT